MCSSYQIFTCMFFALTFHHCACFRDVSINSHGYLIISERLTDTRVDFSGHVEVFLMRLYEEQEFEITAID